MKTKRFWLGGAVLALAGLTGCQTWFGGMTLPSGRYLEHYPQYAPAEPTFPLPRELASQEDPEGAARRAIGAVGAAKPAPFAPAPPVVQAGGVE
jgi:hypothetical protein